METHLHNLRLCFQKCKEYRSKLNLKICAFIVFFGMIIGFIISKKGKLLDPKKIQVIMNMLISHNSLEIQVFNGMAQFYTCFIKNFAMIMAPITKFTQKTKGFYVDRGVLESLGVHKT
jgi:hypothetical protein